MCRPHSYHPLSTQLELLTGTREKADSAKMAQRKAEEDQAETETVLERMQHDLYIEREASGMIVRC